MGAVHEDSQIETADAGAPLNSLRKISLRREWFKKRMSKSDGDLRLLCVGRCSRRGRELELCGSGLTGGREAVGLSAAARNVCRKGVPWTPHPPLREASGVSVMARGAWETDSRNFSL